MLKLLLIDYYIHNIINDERLSKKNLKFSIILLIFVTGIILIANKNFIKHFIFFKVIGSTRSKFGVGKC